MKIALFGNGKTGGKVKELAADHELVIFDSKNLPNLSELEQCDVAIVFLSGPTFERYVDLLIEASISVVIGSTGSNWQQGLDAKLKRIGLAWVYAPNFSASMAKVKSMIETASSVQDQTKTPLIEETHHIDKVDSPSGTALAWQNWLGQEVEFIDYREADTYGVHKLTIETASEKIVIEHTVKDRAAFAHGALDAAERLNTDQFKPGLTNLLD